MRISPPWRRAVIAIVVAISFMIAVLLIDRLRGNRSPVAAIVNAANSVRYRPIATRLSGDFEYKPLQPASRAARGDAINVQGRWKIASALAEAQQRADTAPDSAALHATGAGHLLLEGFDDAISALERAVLIDGGTGNLNLAVRHSRSADLLNDLACAYVTRGQRLQRDSDFLRAVPAIERSWQLEKTPASAWNRALLYEALYLNREASVAWRDVLALERADGWRAEAMLHQQALAVPTEEEQWRKEEPLFLAAIRSGDRDRVGNYGRRYAPRLFVAGSERIARWANEMAQGHPAAASALREARLIAEALAPVDPFLKDAVATIDVAASAPDSRHLRNLIRGITLLNEGRRLYQERRLDEALTVLHTATAVLDDAASCMSATSRVLTASCLVFSQRYQEAGTEIAFVRSDRRVRHRYPRVFAQAEWIAGLSLLAAGKPYEALEAYFTARDVFERSADTASLAAVEDLVGEAYEHLGLPEKSWRHRRGALALNARSGVATRSEAIFGGAARAAIKLGQYSAALQFVDSIIPAKRGEPFALAELLVLRGAIREHLGLDGPATEDFREARIALSRVPAGAARDAVANDIRAVQLLVGARINAAVAEAAIADAARTENKFRLVPLLRRRALSAIHNDVDTAVQHAEAALSEMERQLSGMRDADIRLTSQRSLHDLYGSLIATSVARGDTRRAAELLDCQREHNRLGGSGGPCAAVPFDALPQGIALLDYAVIADAVYVFTFYRGSMAVRRVSPSAATIDHRAREFVTAVQSGDDERARNAAAALSADLFDPFVGDLRDTSAIVIGGSPASIPVPFAALWSRRTGRFLLEDWTITYTPGVSRLVSAVRRDLQLRKEARAELDLFAIAPAYGDSTLPPLPSAAMEARVIRRLYDRTAGVTGTAATSQSFHDIGSTASVIHFAGHSIPNPEQPRYAALAFGSASDQFTSDMLYAHQIASSALSATRLVVLASCSSASSGDQPSIAPTSLSDAFLDAHVPAVVGTMWSVEDQATGSLLIDFHQQLRAGRAAPDALRLAQIAALRSGDLRRSRLQQWAPYCFIGWHSST